MPQKTRIKKSNSTGRKDIEQSTNRYCKRSSSFRQSLKRLYQLIFVPPAPHRLPAHFHCCIPGPLSICYHYHIFLMRIACQKTSQGVIEHVILYKKCLIVQVLYYCAIEHKNIQLDLVCTIFIGLVAKWDKYCVIVFRYPFS